MKSIIISILVCVFLVASGLSASGQEWTAEQKEVWEMVKADWEACKNGDVEATMADRHDKALSLYSSNPTPLNSEQVRKQNEGWLNSAHKPTSFNIDPIAISIIDNVAIVYYLYKWESELTGFKQKGRTMNTFIKQNNSWKFIGSLSASCEDKAPCPYKW